MAARRVCCLGPRGSFSVRAAEELCPCAEIVPLESFPQVFRSLTEGGADCAVVPIENSIQGGVLQNLDLLAETEGVFATREKVLSIDHRLVTKGNVPLKKIERVYSHEQAIGQCSEYLEQFLPHAKRVFTSSTAESLSLLDGRSAGIVGAHVTGEGLVLSDENIANVKHNFTRFMLLEKRDDLPERSDMIFFAAVCEHRPGSLLDLLKIFAERGLNLTRIESRPLREAFGEYRFFIELSGDAGDGRVRDALKTARTYCRRFRVLGAY